MGSGHGHGFSGTHEPATNRRTIVVLLLIVVPILLATAVAMVALWPHGKPPAGALTPGNVGSLQETVRAEVLTSSARSCEGTSEDRLPDGTIPKTVTCASAQVRISSGDDQGKTVTIAVPTPVFRTGISPGDRIILAEYPAAPGDSADGGQAGKGSVIYAWSDYSRGQPLVLLAVLFVLVVVGVARLRGVAAIAGLAIAYLSIIKFMLPALRLGENSAAVALAGSIVVMTVVLYLAHGISAKTTTALLGTYFGLALTVGLASWASSAVHLNGLSSEANLSLTQLTGLSDLSGIILCGIIVAGLGVLNDVTITQASAVWEVHLHAPDLGVRGLFLSGMRVGRDHLASTVYTIAFAYAGAALPTLILIDLYQQPIGQVLTSGQIAEEIVRTLVGSIGLVLAIPVTTMVAALVVSSAPKRLDHEPSDAPPARARGRRAIRA